MLLILTLNAQELEKVKLQLKWKNQFQSAGFIVAKEKGFYRELGLDVSLVEYMNNTKTVDDLESGKIQFAVSDSSAILSRMNGSKIKAILVILQKSPFVLLSLKSSNINSVKDLNGKKIALVDEENGVIIKSLLKSNHIRYSEENATFDLKKLLSKEFDVITSYISNEPFVAKENNIEVSIINPADYGFDGYGDILITSEKLIQTNPKLVSKMYEATKKGWLYAFENIEEVSGLIYKKYNTLDKSKRALEFEGEKLKKLSAYGKNFGALDLAKVKSIGQLYSFMIKGKHSIENLNDFEYKPAKAHIYLTKEEQEYLDSMDSIPMCYYTTLSPYTMMKSGKPVGVSVDYFKEVEKIINKKFNLIYANTIKEQFTLAYEKKCLAVPIIQTAPQTVPFIKATLAGGKDNLVLVTRIDEPYIFNMDKLNTKKIGINKEFIHLTEYLDTNHPEIKYIKIEGNGLKQVENDELFGAIGTSIIMNYELNKKFKNSLKVMTDYPDSYVQGSIGVHSDEVILLSILNKAISIMEPITQEEIFDKWIDEKYEKITDYTLVWKIIFVSSILILISLLWNRRLKLEIKKRKVIEDEKSIIFDKLQQIANGYVEFIDELPIGMVSSDPMGIEESHYNRTFFKMFGWNLEEIDTIDKWFAKAYPNEEYREEVIKEWGEKVEEAKRENRSSSTPMEVKVTCKDGSIKWCQARYYEKMKFINAGIFVDISERKKAEDSLFELNRSLEERVEFEISKNKKHQLLMMEQVKLAQMGEMIENIAHQWRQPLAQVNISIFIIDELLKRNNFTNELIDSKLLEIEDLTEYMSNTIDNFQNFFNSEKEEVLFYIREIIEKSITIIQGTLSSNFTKVEVNVDSLLEFKGYPLELQQVLVVLLSNANDVLKTRKINNPNITINIEDLADTYVVSISDNAGGVNIDNLEQVFEPYYTTKHKSQGRGIGLYMAKMIIEEGMKGKLTLENKTLGACFSIKILKEKKSE